MASGLRRLVWGGQVAVAVSGRARFPKRRVRRTGAEDNLICLRGQGHGAGQPLLHIPVPVAGWAPVLPVRHAVPRLGPVHIVVRPVVRARLVALRLELGQGKAAVGQMPDADAPHHPRLAGGLVEDVLQNGRAAGRGHDLLGGLAQGEGAFVLR
ncbi:hypothetical protein ANANG_G00234790 [Anguilla anguilla]|uniref:Uncharacterized protein n=1 Tax=Anguilla anguilla TaxID=7936 RepID=A0A9D3LU29_ANGAN|nr:hypothetical protein ANANG_G00234790 [Anguilla anguilla]